MEKEAEKEVSGDSEEVSKLAPTAPGPAPAQPPDKVQPERDVGHHNINPQALQKWL